MMKIFRSETIGKLRKMLFTVKQSKWNAFVRDITALLG